MADCRKRSGPEPVARVKVVVVVNPLEPSGNSLLVVHAMPSGRMPEEATGPRLVGGSVGGRIARSN
jgi:hypothetical protein